MFPNPTRQRTTVMLALDRKSQAEVRVFDVSGRTVRRLASTAVEGGASLQLTWDLTDETGRRVSPGVYWVRARTEGRSLQRTVLVLR